MHGEWSIGEDCTGEFKIKQVEDKKGPSKYRIVANGVVERKRKGEWEPIGEKAR